MVKGFGYALASAGICAAVILTGFVLATRFGLGVLVIAVILALLGICTSLVTGDALRRRRLFAAEQRRLAQERDHVRRTVDFVADPGLTEQERLAVIDCFIPRLGRHPARSPYRDRFVIVRDLAPAARALLERARAAVMSVYTSEVLRLRLLDGLANEVLLPRQIWEIALLLRVQTHLRQEQERAMRGVVTPELRAVLEPQQEALRRSEAAVEARVKELERYAYRVGEADAAIRARAALANNDKYRALLAHTDDADGMRALEAQGDALEETLAKSVREAIEAGQTLAT
ncbi:hypothetical protein [Nonomuraea sp. NPDC050643]|uniref:hypothetical protein n=1 Tax=Nonomuraea sp. NPDC050643 TaxID=3155660 RepID=UPI0033E06C5C